MNYLDRTVKECVRISPAVPLVVRQVCKDMNLNNGFIAPRGAGIAAFIENIHHNSLIYPNPEKFDPDRFLPENFAKIPTGAYVPFGLGPRNCIGKP